MKILLVTGRDAAKEVRKYAKELEVPAMVHVSDAGAASLLSPEGILGELSHVDLKGYSWIIVPGMVRGDVSLVEKNLGIPCFKGPRNIADLPYVMEKALHKGLKLSPVVSVDVLLENDRIKEDMKELDKALARPKKFSMKLGKKNPVYLGSGISRVIAEINDAPLLSDPELERLSRYFVSCGADVIDIGMPSGGGNSKRIGDIVGLLRSTVSVPLSIDSLDPKEILAAADAGIDLVLSIDSCNCQVLDSLTVPMVVIPRDRKGIVPKKWEEKLRLFESLLKKTGGKDVILDPVLSPVNFGFAKSACSYLKLRERFPGKPMMLGAGNVTELIDADSVGVNALLAAFASEVSIDLIFTTEASAKTKGSVRELSTAAKMMYLSKKRNQPPKDLGMDLLVLKDKRRILQPRAPEEKGIPVVHASERKENELEDACFRIYLTDRINVAYYLKGTPIMTIAGDSAGGVYREIIARGLIKSLGHAAYLGRELGKAEIALRLGKNFVQDEGLFNLP